MIEAGQNLSRTDGEEKDSEACCHDSDSDSPAIQSPPKLHLPKSWQNYITQQFEFHKSSFAFFGQFDE